MHVTNITGTNHSLGFATAAHTPVTPLLSRMKVDYSINELSLWDNVQWTNVYDAWIKMYIEERLSLVQGYPSEMRINGDTFFIEATYGKTKCGQKYSYLTVVKN